MRLAGIQVRWSFAETAVAFCGFNSALAYLLIFLLPHQLHQYYSLPRPAWWQFEGSRPELLLAGWLILFQLYYLAYRACPARPSRPLLTLLFTFPLFFSILLYFMYPIGSNDIFDQVFRGHMHGNLGAVPFGRRPDEFPGDPLLPYAFWQSVPGTYGPVWHLLIGAISRLVGPDLLANLLGYKLLALAHYWGAVILVYLALRRFRPEHSARGLVLFAWNPLLLFEAVGSAHNDVLLLFWLVLAVLLLLKDRHLLALLAFTMAALVKFISAMLLPLFLVALWHAQNGKPAAERLKHLGLAAAAMGGLALLVYSPFGIGGALASLTNLTDMTGIFRTSTPGLAFYLLHNGLGLAWLEPQHVRNLFLLLTAALILWHTVALFRVGPDPRTLKHELLRRAFEILFIYLLAGSPWLWPWYLTWLFAFAPFLHGSGYAERVIVFCLTSLSTYFIWFYNWPLALPAGPEAEQIIALISVVPAAIFSLAAWLYNRRRGRAASVTPVKGAGQLAQGL